MSVTLDSGVLIALERNDRAMWVALKLAALENEDVLVPSAALARVWRGVASQARLAAALQRCVIASFDSVAKPLASSAAEPAAKTSATPTSPSSRPPHPCSTRVIQRI